VAYKKVKRQILKNKSISFHHLINKPTPHTQIQSSTETGKVLEVFDRVPYIEVI